MSISIQQLTCQNCGAAFEQVLSAVLCCQHCQSQYVQSQPPRFQILPALPKRRTTPAQAFRLELAGQTYALLGLLGRGEYKEAWLVEREGAFGQLGVLKRRIVGAALEREWSALEELTDAQTGPWLQRLLPRPLALDLARGLALYSFLPGFVHAPDGLGELAPVHLVWIANRLLEQLHDLHGSGFRQARLERQHWLICARDHGVALCSWSGIERGPGDSDLSQLGRQLVALATAKTPKPLVRAFSSFADGRAAWQIRQDLKALALSLLGPPRFVPLQIQ